MKIQIFCDVTLCHWGEPFVDMTLCHWGEPFVDMTLCHWGEPFVVLGKHCSALKCQELPA